MTDIRLDTEFFVHPKTRKLIRRTGLEGVIALQRLWMWCAKNRPDGSLAGMDMEDIALAAGWEDADSENAFALALVELRWLDKTEEGYVLHDWAEHNPWAADSENRGNKARLLRLARANPAAYAEYKADGRTGISKAEYQDALTHVQEKDTARSTARSTARTTHVQENATARSTPDPDPDPTSKPPPPPIAPPLPPAVGSGDDADDGAPPPNCPATVQTVQPVDSSPGEHMPLPECADLYRQCFAGKNHLQVAPMVLAKLSVLASSHSRAEMLHAFEQAANAGATSVNYLEAVLSGKGRDKPPPGKAPSKTGEAKERLRAWAGEDWLRREIAVGVMRLWADGKRDGMPSAETVVLTAANYEDELLHYQLTEEEVDRVKAAFDGARRSCKAWPRGRDICDFLPRRRPQDALPEETVRGSPMPLWTGFMEMKKHDTSSGANAPPSPRGEGFENGKENKQP